ncbi:hypothetical protein SAMD00023353_5500120 [Rosellinia necatrix]|uniref:Uncharacterized protein n=1 Tax=Rosellinia necatrix TaxID=77044 RepID=A0A1S8AA23_ROSNE|nr:hypothetical protein SAMD00023353_5500120 [Rosellinia necatrix]
MTGRLSFPPGDQRSLSSYKFIFAYRHRLARRLLLSVAADSEVALAASEYPRRNGIPSGPSAETNANREVERARQRGPGQPLPPSYFPVICIGLAALAVFSPSMYAPAVRRRRQGQREPRRSSRQTNGTGKLAIPTGGLAIYAGPFAGVSGVMRRDKTANWDAEFPVAEAEREHETKPTLLIRYLVTPC